MALSFAKKAGLAAATAAALAGVSLGASAFAATSGPAAHPAGAPVPVAQSVASAHTPASRVVTRVIGRGVVDGHRWSVTTAYYPTLPKGYTLPPDESTLATSLLCERMVVGGVRIDHQGGPWADCRPVAPGRIWDMGLWGRVGKGLHGSRLFVATEANTASAVVTLSNGTRLTAHAVPIPGTDGRSWAVAIPNGTTIATVDQYDTHHHHLTHDTTWR